jgi:hypothetical protein
MSSLWKIVFCSRRNSHPGKKKRTGEVSLNSTDIKSIRRFGVIAFFFFGCLSGLGFWWQKPIPSYLFGFLSLLGLGFILLPLPMKPVYGTWLKISHFLGRLVTMMILTLAYYLVITPAAIIKRVVGGRPLPLKPDKNASSYWVRREEPAQPRERFPKRF